jgi:hypothetical protein
MRTRPSEVIAWFLAHFVWLLVSIVFISPVVLRPIFEWLATNPGYRPQLQLYNIIVTVVVQSISYVVVLLIFLATRSVLDRDRTRS